MLAQKLRANAFSSGKASCRGRQAAVVRCSTATTTAYKLNINNCVDKAHEGKSLKAITQLSPEALQGLGPKAEAALAAVNVKSIEQLGTWKLYKAAKAIAVLAATEESGKRAEGAASNINGILDKAWESASLQEILAAPPSALQGLGPKSDAALADLNIKTVEDLGSWKYAAWADALVTLAEYENADFSS